MWICKYIFMSVKAGVHLRDLTSPPVPGRGHHACVDCLWSICGVFQILHFKKKKLAIAVRGYKQFKALSTFTVGNVKWYTVSLGVHFSSLNSFHTYMKHSLCCLDWSDAYKILVCVCQCVFIAVSSWCLCCLVHAQIPVLPCRGAQGSGQSAVGLIL